MIDLIKNSAPVNKQASMAFSKGCRFNPEGKIHPTAIMFDILPDLPEYPGLKEDDLTGLKYSRLEVVGYWGKSKPGRGTAWVVRCKCGMYEIRRRKGILKAVKGLLKNNVHRCSICERFAHSKRHQDYTKLGFNRYETLDKY